ncbi:MAG: hypothetical protein ABFS56_26375 [Pseudomonadota bacterium]
MAYKVKPKSMKKLADILGVKVPDNPDEPANNAPNVQDAPVYDEPPIDTYAQYAPGDIEQYEFTPGDYRSPNDLPMHVEAMPIEDIKNVLSDEVRKYRRTTLFLAMSLCNTTRENVIKAVESIKYIH